ncbi:hypothetical protein DSECCO2_522740 [anaerobic digester metagenome]
MNSSLSCAGSPLPFQIPFRPWRCLPQTPEPTSGVDPAIVLSRKGKSLPYIRAIRRVGKRWFASYPHGDSGNHAARPGSSEGGETAAAEQEQQKRVRGQFCFLPATSSPTISSAPPTTTGERGDFCVGTGVGAGFIVT